MLDSKYILLLKFKKKIKNLLLKFALFPFPTVRFIPGPAEVALGKFKLEELGINGREFEFPFSS